MYQSLSRLKPRISTLSLIVFFTLMGCSESNDGVEANNSECSSVAPVINGVVATPAAPNTDELIKLDIDFDDNEAEDGCDDMYATEISTQFASMPAGSNALLSPSVGGSPAFIADVPGVYVLRTSVTELQFVGDPTSATQIAIQETTVTVGPCGSHPPVAQIEVLAPVTAGPGTDVTSPRVDVDTIVVLDAGSSTDADLLEECGLSEKLSYVWEFVAKPAGSAAELNDAAIRNPSLTPDKPGDYELFVEVSDGIHTSVASLTIKADPGVAISTPVGYTVEYVDGGGKWYYPVGCVVTEDGSIYTAQEDGTILKTVNGYHSVFTHGNLLSNLSGLSYLPSDGSFYASSSYDKRIVKIDKDGNQSLFTDEDTTNVPNFFGIDIFQNTDGDYEMIVSMYWDDQVAIYDPTDPAPASPTATYDFAPSNLDSPVGVAGTAIDGETRYYVGHSPGLSSSQTGTTTYPLLFADTGGFSDIVVLPNGNLVVADANSTVTLVEDCGGDNCRSETIAYLYYNDWEPFALALDPDGSVLIVDYDNHRLFRITGSFEILP